MVIYYDVSMTWITRTEAVYAPISCQQGQERYGVIIILLLLAAALAGKLYYRTIYTTDTEGQPVPGRWRGMYHNSSSFDRLTIIVVVDLHLHFTLMILLLLSSTASSPPVVVVTAGTLITEESTNKHKRAAYAAVRADYTPVAQQQ